MAAEPHFTHELFDFLFDLDIHNEKAWFDTNRERFETHVRGPMLRFIADAGAPLHRRVSRHVVADARKQGGSMFRINRNRMFNREAPPYKTWAAAQFRHEAGKDVHAPGLYVHLEPGNCFLGAGMWRPEREALAAIRTRIDRERAAWKRARNAVVKAGWTFAGDSLKTAPRGWDADHPLIEDLRRKDIILTRPVDEDEVVAPGFLDACIASYAEARPVLRFLGQAVDLPL